MRKTKAGQLLKVAYATYRQGEVEIAKDIFVLAMEDPSAPVELGETGFGMEELKQQLDAAIAEGNLDMAAQHLSAMKALGQPCAGQECGGQEEGEVPEEEEETDEGEGTLSPGDMVEPPPIPELAPAQIASLVTLARKVKASGHADLSRKIIKSLGL